LINTNKIELGDDKIETRMVTTVVKLASKFLNKMQEHIDDNSIPKDIPALAKSFFVEATGGGFTLAPKTDLAKKGTATQPNGKAAKNVPDEDKAILL
jgi:hypothetical protein